MTAHSFVLEHATKGKVLVLSDLMPDLYQRTNDFHRNHIFNCDVPNLGTMIYINILRSKTVTQMNLKLLPQSQLRELYFTWLNHFHYICTREVPPEILDLVFKTLLSHTNPANNKIKDTKTCQNSNFFPFKFLILS